VSFVHYTRKSGKRYSRFAFLICAGCYGELGAGEAHRRELRQD
jgi:hypothetical protein